MIVEAAATFFTTAIANNATIMLPYLFLPLSRALSLSPANATARNQVDDSDVKALFERSALQKKEGARKRRHLHEFWEAGIEADETIEEACQRALVKVRARPPPPPSLFLALSLLRLS